MNQPTRFESESQASGLNLELDPVEKFIFSGLQQSCLRIFQAPAVWCTSTDKVKAIQAIFKNGKVKYPYIFLMLDTLTESEERGNSKASALRGLPAVLSTDMRRDYRVQYAQVDFRISLEFVTNDYAELLRFANRWMFARKLGHLKFQVAYGSLSFGINSILDNSLEIPKREADATNITEYVLTTGLLMHGYMTNPVLLEGQIKDTVEITTSIPEKDPVTGANRTVWTINSSLDQLQTGQISNAGYDPQQL